jgi:hypothetical protein
LNGNFKLFNVLSLSQIGKSIGLNEFGYLNFFENEIVEVKILTIVELIDFSRPGSLLKDLIFLPIVLLF